MAIQGSAGTKPTCHAAVFSDICPLEARIAKLGSAEPSYES